MQSSVFAGRVEELQLLFQCLARAAAGEPRIVLLEGAPGSGRSRLLAEFARRLAEREDVAVIRVAAPASPPYDPVAVAAGESLALRLYQQVGGRRRSREAARALLPDWLGAIPGVGNLVAAIVATLDALRRRRQRRSVTPITADDETDALLDTGARRTLVLLLDDLEAIEPQAAARLEALLRAAEGRARLLVVGTSRSLAPGTRPPPIHTMVAALPPTLTRRHTLDELTPGELAAWLRKRFPHVEIPDSFLGWLQERTGGHPAAVEALLDRLITRSVIRFVDRHWEIGATPTDLPPPADAPPAVDLGGLGAATGDLLREASALGLEFDGLTLSRALGRDELEVEDGLAVAVRHGILAVDGEATVEGEIATRYRFQSAHLRVALFQGLPAERRGEPGPAGDDPTH